MSNATDSEARLNRILNYQRALAGFSRAASEAISPDRLLQHACAHVSRVTHIEVNRKRAP